MLQERPQIDKATLDIAAKVRSNLFPWRGQFSPQLVEAHLEVYAKKGERVLDPFLGSGTVLIESARRGLAAVGAEINPAAALMARVYELAQFDPSSRAVLLAQIDDLLCSFDNHQDLPLFSSDNQKVDLFELLLEKIASQTCPKPEMVLLSALIILLDGGTIPLSISHLKKTWQHLRSVVEGLPYTHKEVVVKLCDARKLSLPNSCIDFVFTSPPYVNVFNYHQQYRESVESLEWKILPLARSEIGSNRKHRGNRFFTVVQYCLDMAQVFVEIKRVCKPGARVVFVVGRESNVRKTAFFNGKILQGIAEECASMSLVLKQERVFQNRFGKDIYEDILHFVVDDSPVKTDWLENARHLAETALVEASPRTPSEAQQDLAEAIEKGKKINSSPLMSLQDQPHWISLANESETPV